MTDDERQANRRERWRIYRRTYYESHIERVRALQRAYVASGLNAEYCRRYRQGQKARAALETASVCDRCGINFERCRRVPGTNLCMDCGED